MDPTLANQLADYAETGLLAEFFAMPDACATCHAFAGQSYDPPMAPPIPVPGCENEQCRCDYLPDTTPGPRTSNKGFSNWSTVKRRLGLG